MYYNACLASKDLCYLVTDWFFFNYLALQITNNTIGYWSWVFITIVNICVSQLIEANSCIFCYKETNKFKTLKLKVYKHKKLMYIKNGELQTYYLLFVKDYLPLNFFFGNMPTCASFNLIDDRLSASAGLWHHDLHSYKK